MDFFKNDTCFNFSYATYACVCPPVPYSRVFGADIWDLANPIITLIFWEISPILDFLPDASPSEDTTFYIGSWGGRPLMCPILVGFGGRVVDSCVNYPGWEGGFSQHQHFF